jgi:multidrug efflux system membrane fusion protein
LKKEIGSSVGKTKVYAQLQGETEPSATGVLDFIDHQLNQTSGTVAVRGEFPNEKHHLIPGFYARFSIEASDGRDALVLPRSVVQTDQQGDYVFTVSNDNIAHRRTITIAPLPDENVEVTKGLIAGEKVVVEGYTRVSDGQVVQIGK